MDLIFDRRFGGIIARKDETARGAIERPVDGPKQDASWPKKLKKPIDQLKSRPRRRRAGLGLSSRPRLARSTFCPAVRRRAARLAWGHRERRRLSAKGRGPSSRRCGHQSCQSGRFPSDPGDPGQAHPHLHRLRHRISRRRRTNLTSGAEARLRDKPVRTRSGDRANDNAYRASLPGGLALGPPATRRRDLCRAYQPAVLCVERHAQFCRCLSHRPRAGRCADRRRDSLEAASSISDSGF